MLAHQIVERMRVVVFVRTTGPQWTVAFAECFAKRPIRVQTKPVFSLEEVGECEIGQLIVACGLHSRGSVGGRYPMIH